MRSLTWAIKRAGVRDGELVRQLMPMLRKNGERVQATMAGRRVMIWSQEHGAFWRSNGCGYVETRNGAGIYRFEDAFARTRHCGPEKKIMFVEAR